MARKIPKIPKIPVAAHERAPAKRTPAFSKTGKGIHAHGTVSGLTKHHDGQNYRMIVQHGKGRKNPDGLFTHYPDETTVTLPQSAAQQFRIGQRVRVSVHPHGPHGAAAADNDGDE